MKFSGLAHRSKLFYQTMGQLDRHRHQLRCFVAGVAEHEPLIAGTLLLVQAFALGDPLGDIGGLTIKGNQHGAGVGIEAHAGIGITDFTDGGADDFRVIDDGVGGYLAGDDRHAGGNHGFAGHAGAWILGQYGIEDGIGYLIGHLIGMPFGHGL